MICKRTALSLAATTAIGLVLTVVIPSADATEVMLSGSIKSASGEKIEGVTFGPDLADGRRLLLVTSDNDLAPAADSLIYAFAIDPALLPGFRRPVIAPGIDIRPGPRPQRRGSDRGGDRRRASHRDRPPVGEHRRQRQRA